MVRQCELPGLFRSSVYYQLQPVSESDLVSNSLSTDFCIEAVDEVLQRQLELGKEMGEGGDAAWLQHHPLAIAARPTAAWA